MATTAATTARLSVRAKLGFGIADLGGNLFFTAMGFWSLAFLTDVAGLGAALAGAAVMVGKLWDAVTDPMMGYISDRTRTRWGRRRPYLLFGAVPLMLAMWFFFTNPGIRDQAMLAAWAIFALCLLNTAYTVVNIPYSALTPDLTQDYHERMSLNGYRFGAAVFGTIFGAGAVLPIVGLFASRNAGWSAAGASMGLIMAVTTLITFFSVREGEHSKVPLPKEKFLETFLVVFKNRPYVILVATYAVHLFALTFVQGALFYYFKWIYDRKDPTMAMIILLLVAMVFIPVSVLTSKRIGKKRTYQICFAILAAATLLIYFLQPSDGAFLAIMVFAGVGVGFGYAAPFAMLPDAIELDALKSGERKEGAFYGMWTFMSKVGTSLSVALSGLLLQLGSYDPGLAAQPERAREMIRLIVGPVPAVGFALALLLVELYPLDEKAYRAILDAEARPAAEA